MFNPARWDSRAPKRMGGFRLKLLPGNLKLPACMEPAPARINSLTPAQRQAVAARGNVLVMAGAGTGKTKTLVERCLDCLERDRAGLDELLIVTFTEAAAAEMRLRLRRVLEQRLAEEPENEHWHRQLALFDVAHIGTLHSFCFRLVREHFYELGLDPQLSILDDGEARELARETLDELLLEHYEGADNFSLAVRQLIQFQGGGRDEKIRSLILRLHHYSQARPDAAGWLAGQIEKFTRADPVDWQQWLLQAVQTWRDEWLPILESLIPGNAKAVELIPLLQTLKREFSRAVAAEALSAVLMASTQWPKGKKTVLSKPLTRLFSEAGFLHSLAAVTPAGDPLAEDWNWVRGHMAALLQLTQQFSAGLLARKRTDGVLDFHDLEQFALKLLWDFSTEQPTAVASAWRQKIRFVFVDEYQDINAAQDKIIAALAREGEAANRFLVGDVKQSIYRFRLADPEIFRAHAKNWHGPGSGTISLAENFRSRAGVLDFSNSLFSLIMQEAVGGVTYGPADRLIFGAPDVRADLASGPGQPPRVELLLRIQGKPEAGADAEENPELADLEESAREARLLARELNRLIQDGHQIWDEGAKTFRGLRPGDIAVLLRSPRGKAETYAKEFDRAGLPLVVARGGFFESAEILDLLSLLQLLDNPLQDVPCIAVLRSPLVGLTLEELGEIRLQAPGKHFWTALNRAAKELADAALKTKLVRFLEQCSRWRQLVRQASLSECLETVLTDTYYAEWLRTQPRGTQAGANVEQFLSLAQQFDRLQRQGLTRFLQFIEVRRELDATTEAPAVIAEDAVRLMSIHQSKGLEFPVVALPDLGKNFNEQDLNGEIIFDEAFGLCPQVKPPQTGRRYPSLPYWLARRRQKRELRGEELRLLYVALTRARDTLLLLAGISSKKWDDLWTQPVAVTAQKLAEARSFADWIGLWFGQQRAGQPIQEVTQGLLPGMSWRLVEDAELARAAEAAIPLSGKATASVEPLSEPALDRLQSVLSWEYPQLAATKQKAKASVTELRRLAMELDPEGEAAPLFAGPEFVSERGDSKLSAADQGIAHHKFLQHVALNATGDLAAEAGRMASAAILTEEERAALDLAALALFWDSELGRILRDHASEVRRELAFTARFSPAEISAITGQPVREGMADEFVVVQGAADLVLIRPEEIWLVDFKTDHLRPAGLATKVKRYEPQVKLYAAALEKIFKRPVTVAVLHFLAVKKTASVIGRPW